MTPTLDALLRLLALDRMPRTGWLQVGVPDPESVAAHSAGAALLALRLGGGLDPALDLDRTVALLVVHDAAEALTGDLPLAGARLLPPGAKRLMEEAAAAELFGAPAPGHAPGPGLARWLEAADRRTPEARLAKACDRLHLGLRALGYARAGQRGLGEFAAGLADDSFAEFPPAEALRLELVAELRRLEPDPAS